MGTIKWKMGKNILSIYMNLFHTTPEVDRRHISFKEVSSFLLTLNSFLIKYFIFLKVSKKRPISRKKTVKFSTIIFIQLKFKSMKADQYLRSLQTNFESQWKQTDF